MKENVGWLYPKNSILKRIVDSVALEMTQAGIDKYKGPRRTSSRGDRRSDRNVARCW